MENVPAKPQLIESAGREAFDDDVGVASELEQNVGAARVLEIERQ